jgi:hypothetical protein
MPHSRFLPIALAAVLGAAGSGSLALAVPAPDASVSDGPILDASMTADVLLGDCVSPHGTGQHTACLVTVGSMMDGVKVAANTSHQKPSICIPADLERQTVADEFIYLMGAGNGAFDKEKAAFLVRGVLMTLYPCK